MNSFEELSFDVNAKTARLIGRENISGVNGALLELIKNSYDADAEFCLVYFNMPFPMSGMNYEQKIVEKVLSKDDFLIFSNIYTLDSKNSIYRVKDGIDDKELSLLESVLFKYNKIIVADNGTGMDFETVKTSWMNIGTKNKETQYSSAKGRIKTGAKGIGRFAIDKLACKTDMFTKTATSDLIKWSINWDDFSTAKNLSDVKATVELNIGDNIKDVMENILPEKTYNLIKDKIINSGTVIIMSPTREQWSTRLFKSLYNNLMSLNPLQSSDKFDVFVENEFFNDYSFMPRQNGLSDNDYDYHIVASYDGDGTLELVMHRNEFRTDLEKLTLDLDDKNHEYVDVSSNLFWDRKAISTEFYCKENYFKPVHISFKVTDLLQEEPISEIKKIGKFEFEFYFLKKTSATFDIVKKVNQKARGNLMDYFSGIKIYRDNFKVRPYGDKETNFYDWLNLSARSQKSPAAVTKQDGKWRVEPYQLIGSLKISRIDNPYLNDMANREGIEPNDTYRILIDLMVKIIEQFEFDRQFYYRQYDQLIKEQYDIRYTNENKIFQDFKSIPKHKRKTNYTSEELSQALDVALNKIDAGMTQEEILLALGTSGLLASTFSHELRALQTGFETDISFAIKCLRSVINEEDYDGDEDLNPYKALEMRKKSDLLLAAWVSMLSNSIAKKSLLKEKLNLNKIIENGIELWRPLLEEKHIKIEFYNSEEECVVDSSISEVMAIINNFILNSVWFLKHVSNKTIRIGLMCNGNHVQIKMENNGEELNSEYKQTPRKIFDLGETSKYEKNEKTGETEKVGTGIGLWIVNKIVSYNRGEIEFHKLSDGFTFGFTVQLPESR